MKPETEILDSMDKAKDKIKSIETQSHLEMAYMNGWFSALDWVMDLKDR